MAEGAPPPDATGPRNDWFSEKVSIGLHTKAEKFKKLLASEEGGRPMLDFMTLPDVMRIFVCEGAKELTCFETPPANQKKKMVYFLKLNKVAITAENAKDEVIYGDLNPGVLQHLYDTTSEVYLPLLSNSYNQQGLPEVVVKDVMEYFHRLVAAVYVTIGHSKGETLLPLPPLEMPSADRASKDKERVHVLETAVVTWTKQIKNVLKLDPEHALKAGDHPGPMAEIEFWQAKSKHLNSIHQQLQGEKVRKVMKVLDLTKSTYCSPFNRLCKEVAAACDEANDNAKYLQTLFPAFEKLAQSMGDAESFQALTESFRPTIHTIMLVWKHSKYYNSPARLVVLMREICNDIIRQAITFVSPEQLFEIEPQEAVERLMMTIMVCGKLKSVYFDYKSRANTEVPQNPWRIQNTALFPRLDSFLERCHDLLDLCKTVVQFQKLEKIEIGGNKGRTLSASVGQIYADFTAVLENFIKVPYDVLDVEIKQFDDDFYEFRCSIKELERRLGSVLNQGFDDCATVFAAFKLIESFEGLLEREFIQADLERKHLELLKAYGTDLRDVQDTFTRQRNKSAEGFYLERDGPPLYTNMPPVAGALFWARGLVDRVSEPMAKLQATMKVLLEAEEAKEVTKAYSSLLALLNEFVSEQHTAWSKGVEDVSQEKLKQPLLRRDEATQMLHVNFDPELVKLLREVKYLLELEHEVPASALDLNKKAETFRVQRGSLELITGKYNHIMATMLEVEQPLLQQQLKEIDKKLEKGQKHLTWRSHAIDDFVRETTALVRETFDTLLALKTNMREIEKVLDGWAAQPLIKRKATKTYAPDEFEEEHKAALSARYTEIGNEGKVIHKLLLESNKVLKVSKGAPTWRAYVEFINDIVIDGLARTVAFSLETLNSNLDPAQLTKDETAPLLEVQLELEGTAVEYRPALSDSSAALSAVSLRAMVDAWLKGFFHVTKLIKRLDRAEGDFLKEVAESETVRVYVHMIQSHLDDAEKMCETFTEAFTEYKPLWTLDIADSLAEFLEANSDSKELTEEQEMEAMEGPLQPKAEPPLKMFDDEIAGYVKQAKAIGQLASVAARGWLKVDSKPVKQALATWVNKWQFQYTNYLQESVSQTLVELSDFMRSINEGLSREVEPDDAEALLKAMTCIRDVRLRDETVAGLFDPLRGKVLLLKKYGVSISEDYIEMLENAPYDWSSTTKATYSAREQLAPLQALQAEKIKEQAEEFGFKVADFRASFTEEAPFNYAGYETCYASLDEWSTKIDEIEAEAKALQAREQLFDVTIDSWKEIKQCRSELVFLKLVWDHVELVENIFNSWRLTLFTEVNLDSIMVFCSKLQKEIKTLAKQVRGWDCYLGLMKNINEMLIVLPLVNDLRDDAMRERHWKKLMRICGKTFVNDDKLTLGVLLGLELHNYADAVAEIVEQARMELKIDKQLSRIENTWMSLQLEYEVFKTTGVSILKDASLTVEALDDHEVALQTMMGNRFMGFFETQITSWKGKLSGVRSVLENWQEVQRQWCSLEAIFIGSEDIREQLPEDAKRFDGIDASFKEQMGDASQTPNPLDACLKDGRDEEFNKALAALELCNRSLADYLETKRKKFPRFYFISQVDLVDTLSKGKHPPAVQEHFSKFTDNLGEIIWDKDNETGKEIGAAMGMISGDKEQVHFSTVNECLGPVEDWLLELMSHCCNMMCEQLETSVSGFLETPRAKWLEDWCSQICITTHQIWYTSEVNQAFERLEQGNDQALKEYLAVQVGGLNNYIEYVLGELTKDMRNKMKTLITIEVHARDVILRFIADRIEMAGDFAWQSQLKYRWDEEKKDCFINISDAEFKYSYEYVGNCGRLVITGLTDRCYITLTQALRLFLGGAPAGPAGTGKTETTKDLGRGLAIWVVVMNCSDQMNYKTMANIFMGLAQTGAWGCFDEFNRIPVEVLSVVAGQYGSILDGIKAEADTIIFEEEKINLVRTIGAFITMNPGYAGRTELPENLKALFRGCAMCVPDFAAIIEIELCAEGFIEAKVLSIKFLRLFQLNAELLSKQDHYDWGLRAIKGILRIAGGNKRAHPERSELEIMMRALRDSNVTKFVNADVGIFLGLVSDIFPKMGDAVKQADPVMTKAVKDVIKAEGKLQQEDVFVNKTVDLAELLGIRHCVFALGAAGAAKSSVWKTLQAAQTHLNVGGSPSQVMHLNPKAVTSDDLYGFVHPATKEPYDGIIAKIMRDFKNDAVRPNAPKWVILDGDIDAEWIESMNTVMDDNKVLTLVSNERIPLTPAMRLIFEISHLKNGSPATVSRAGVLFLNETDVGWAPFYQSWVDELGRENDHIDTKETAWLESLGNQYIPPTLDNIRRNKMKHITPIMDFAMVTTLTSILEGLLTKKNCPSGTDKETYEAYFQFAAIWAFGGAFGADKASDFRKAFSEWWRAEWGKTSFKFPEEGSVFDYFVAKADGAVGAKHWRDVIAGYTHVSTTGEGGADFSAIVVPTMDTTRLSFLMNMLMHRQRPVMFVGGAGSAKSTIFLDNLSQLPDELMFFPTSFNSFTNSGSLQPILESPLEKKTGTMFAPPGTKRLIYFIDDINMPAPDKYNTQSSSALLRQLKDYGGFYDLKKLSFKYIGNVQFMAAMNPTAGSFFIIDRLQRHFGTFATLFPETEVLRTIYSQILTGHFSNGFPEEVQKMSDRIVNAALMLHKLVADSFLPNAVKFVYQWNLRELSRLFEGVLKTTPDYYSDPMPVARLWMHETYRVYGDRLTDVQDFDRFEDMVTRVTKNFFEDFDQDVLFAKPLAFTEFAIATDEDVKPYFQITDSDKLSKILTAKLGEYNESNARMDLVLFTQAMEHICRISRIITTPRGNALLVGVGGSGKQSLTRLAAFISGSVVFQLKLTSSYGMGDFKADMITLYAGSGLKGNSIVFLFTDQQIIDERMLVYFNDLLSSGYIPDLYTPDDKDNIINAIRPEVKAAGLMDSRDNCWNFFIDRVRKNLHVVLCMSPVGNAFRNRCRKFPALTSCSVIDWFHPWPREALISVAMRFLEDVEMETDELKENVAHHMAYVHESVETTTGTYLAAERRNVYTTPKSYLELIVLYKTLLAEGTSRVDALKGRLEAGLVKLREASTQVADMQIQLKDEAVVVEAKKAETDILLVQVGQESAIADEQAELGAIEAEKVGVIQTEVAAFAAQCNADLAAAEPAIQKAADALNGLDKGALTELKAMTSPSAAVVGVVNAVQYMFAPKGGVKKVKPAWAEAKKMMASVDKFLESLVNFDKDNLDLDAKAAVRKFTGPPEAPNPDFNYTAVKKSSLAAAGLCDWVVNVLIYHDIFLDVEPKRNMLLEAEAKLAAANKQLAAVNANVQMLNERKQGFQDQLMAATEEKNNLVAKAEQTEKRLNLAERLVNGLRDEGVRWAQNVDQLTAEREQLVGNMMLASPFIAYIGPFNSVFRVTLWEQTWVPDLRGRGIPCSDELDPLALLTDEATKAGWTTEGLPSDRLSMENAAIITRAARWPLIVDPQLQGITWIRKRETPNGLLSCQQSFGGYLDLMTRSMEEGVPMLLEKVGESFDAVLDPVLARSYISKGRKLVLKLGDKEIDLLVNKDEETGMPSGDPLFRLYLQSKLPNPHYIPEVQAQTTLVNFTVTEKGLEDQLLAVVVQKERPDLGQQKAELTAQQNEFTIKLKKLGDDLLYMLANAEGDILSDEALIISLEEAKATSQEINEKVVIAKETEITIAKAREIYRPIAERGSLMFFLIDQLNVISHMYQFSLDTFNYMFQKALDKAKKENDLDARCKILMDTVTFTIFAYVTRGLFEKHRLIFSSQLGFRIMGRRGELDADEIDFIIKAPKMMDAPDRPESCASWLPESVWGGVHALAERLPEAFAALPQDMDGSWKRWKEWFDNEQPENEPLPGEWKRLPPFQRLLVIRSLRPDRMVMATKFWVRDEMGVEYYTAVPFDLPASFEDSSPGVPVFFLLSPGVDALSDVRAIGKPAEKTEANGLFFSVSLGQGQEIVAEKALDRMQVSGGWAMLQNIELCASWLPKLEKKLEGLIEGAHPEFRVFLAALPQNCVPVQILQNSIKLTNEPPSGLRPNMLRAYSTFNDTVWESCPKQGELKAIIFALCFFHSVVCERRQFGAIGWNRAYPFTPGDLSACITVASNFLNDAPKVPWDDLRYIFGEIMYGGHITDDLDRRLCAAYLVTYVREELLDGLAFFPKFEAPPPSFSYKQYIDYIEETLVNETPNCFGMHANCEINFMTQQADALFKSAGELQPRGGGGAGGMTLQEKVKRILDDIMEKLPDLFSLAELDERTQDERTPYTSVFLQECERMNGLLFEMKRSLAELDLGLKGDLSISEPMEQLMNALFDDKVPGTWNKYAYPSMRSLAAWLSDVLQRQRQLETWTADLATPKVTWLPGMFNPAAFLTAVMQVTARKNELPLDKLAIMVDVTKKSSPDEIEAATRDGAYIYGLFLEGARWDISAGMIDDGILKQLYSPLPVILVKAIMQDKAEQRDSYSCPIYKTLTRGPVDGKPSGGFIFSAGLKTKQSANKWILAGLAGFMDVEC